MKAISVGSYGYQLKPEMLAIVFDFSELLMWSCVVCYQQGVCIGNGLYYFRNCLKYLDSCLHIQKSDYHMIQFSI